MGRELDNLWHDLPIDIDTLAALVEGDLGCQEADAVRERLLAADPELAARVEMMCQDRVVVRTLGDEQPPDGLADAVLGKLEREALLGLADGESGGTIPLSRVRMVRPSPWARGARRLRTPAVMGLAMAAVLALAIGIAMQVLPGSLPRPMPDGEGPLALDTHQPDDRAAGPGGPTDMAVASDVPPAPAGLVTPFAEAGSLAEPGPELLFTGDLDRALVLLGEGRLLVRVRSAEPEATVAQIGRLTGRAARPGEAWRLGGEVAEPVATALHTKFEPVVTGVEERILASADGPEARGAAPRVSILVRPSALEAIYLADARADRAAMASLRAALSVGDGQAAVFEELAVPLEMPRVVTTESVLWWGRPASEWVGRSYVPIVVERVER